MARLSPITVGVLVLAALVGLAAAYLLARAPPAATAAASDAAAPSVSLAPPVLPPRLPLAPRRGPAPLLAPAALSREVPRPAEAPTQGGALMAAVEAIRSPSPLDGGAVWPVRRFPAAALAWRRYRVTQQADDMAFEALKLDEATRAAIRKVNETHRPLPGRLFAPVPDGGSLDPDRLHDAEGTTRRAAIEGVLGVNGAKDFFSAETSARASIENQTAAAKAGAASDGGQPARNTQPADAGADPRGQPPLTPSPPAPAAQPVAPEGTPPPATLPGVEGADPVEPSPSPPPP